MFAKRSFQIAAETHACNFYLGQKVYYVHVLEGGYQPADL